MQCTYKIFHVTDFFVEGTYGLYSQFFLFCIVFYIVFQFKGDLFECMYEIFLSSVVQGKTDNTQEENYLHIARDL